MEMYGFKGSSDGYAEMKVNIGLEMHSEEFPDGKYFMSIGSNREFPFNQRGGFIFMSDPNYKFLMKGLLNEIHYGVPLDDILISLTAKIKDSPYVIIGTDSMYSSLATVRSDLPVFLAQQEDNRIMTPSKNIALSFGSYTEINEGQLIEASNEGFNIYTLERIMRPIIRPMPIGVTPKVGHVSMLEKKLIKEIRL